MDENKIDEISEIEDPLAGLRTEEERDRARRMRPGFANAIAACGLSTEEAMAYLGQSRSAIKKKRAGVLAMTPGDATALSRLWHRIRTGRVEGLDPGPFGMAVTMLVLSGKHVPKRVPRGRPRYVPLDAPAADPSCPMRVRPTLLGRSARQDNRLCRARIAAGIEKSASGIGISVTDLEITLPADAAGANNLTSVRV